MIKIISLAVWEKFLSHVGCKLVRNHKGHAKWVRADLRRPIVYSNHIDPVPATFVRQTLRTLNITPEAFEEIRKTL